MKREPDPHLTVTDGLRRDYIGSGLALSHHSSIQPWNLGSYSRLTVTCFLGSLPLPHPGSFLTSLSLRVSFLSLHSTHFAPQGPVSPAKRGGTGRSEWAFGREPSRLSRFPTLTSFTVPVPLVAEGVGRRNGKGSYGLSVVSLVARSLPILPHPFRTPRRDGRVKG